jgi:hypothetical protein
MHKIRYSRDVDVLLIEFSDKSIDHAEESGPFIVHFSKESEPVLLEILDARQFLIRSFSSVVEEKEVSLP